MKTILPILLLLVATHTLYPQQTARERIEQRRQAETNLNQIKDNQEDEIIENSRWSRIIYRHVDLSNPTNAPLSDLFAIIYTQLQNNNIRAYEFIDGREQFTAEYLINLPDLMNRFGLGNDTEISSNEVQSYYIKEIYYFDTPTSSLRKLPLSICPIIHNTDINQGTIRYPLFWVPYNQISPYLKQMPIMLSELNNSIRGTMDDFFKTSRYSGEIYKTGNHGNLSISQYTSTPEEMKAEQERIEQELTDFYNLIRQQGVNPPSSDRQRPMNQNSTRSVRNNNKTFGTSQSMRNRRY